MDLALVLIVVLIVVILWRGPKTIPLIGRAFGQGVKEARKEIDGIRSDAKGADEDEPKIP
jgi:Sec-independent protein translocase protein TatA